MGRDDLMSVRKAASKCYGLFSCAYVTKTVSIICAGGAYFPGNLSGQKRQTELHKSPQDRPGLTVQHGVPGIRGALHILRHVG